jgi:hypothetical protein
MERSQQSADGRVATKAAASACKEHFAAAEEPELLAEGIPTSFRGLRK